ncbi:hypothetical protein FBU30_003529 [Linnemannia zychae]|nr:hypothetical protein FBU30_003529 [Linnemannia zychae]
MIEGAAGTAVGSRIKGHIKRGGGKMVREHRQVCVGCFSELDKARKRRAVAGSIKVVRLNGSQQCLNPDCPRPGSQICSGHRFGMRWSFVGTRGPAVSFTFREGGSIEHQPERWFIHLAQDTINGAIWANYAK